MGSSAFEPLFFGSGGSMFSMARVCVVEIHVGCYVSRITAPYCGHIGSRGGDAQMGEGVKDV
jgi:hypothetical protein